MLLTKQVVRKADGTARVLMPDGCVGWYGGAGRGWEWTNAKGMRQVEPLYICSMQQHTGLASSIEV
jgi:hypothetical protein